MPVTVERCNPPGDLLHGVVRDSFRHCRCSFREPTAAAALRDAEVRVSALWRPGGALRGCGAATATTAWCLHLQGRGFCRRVADGAWPTGRLGGWTRCCQGWRWAVVVTVPGCAVGWRSRPFAGRAGDCAAGGAAVAAAIGDGAAAGADGQHHGGAALWLGAEPGLPFVSCSGRGVHGSRSTGRAGWHRSRRWTTADVEVVVRIADRAEAWLARQGFGRGGWRA